MRLLYIGLDSKTARQINLKSIYVYNDNIEVLKRPVLLSCCLIFEKQKWAIHRLSTAYPPDKRA